MKKTPTNMTYQKIQEEEAKTWLIENDKERKEKAMREWIRYPLLKKQMGLDYLDTSDMVVWDIGCGPLGGVSTVLTCKCRVGIDPLAKEYGRYFNTKTILPFQAEHLLHRLGTPDLIIVTNAMDHFEDPLVFLSHLGKFMKPSGYFAHFHAIDNAVSHPHKAHQHNLNPQLFKQYLDEDFETCWSMDFQKDGLTYGWKKQPAFCGLYRKVTGYK